MLLDRSRESRLYIVFFMVLLFCLSGGYLYLKLQVIKAGYSFISLQNRKAALEDINRKMMLRLAYLSSFSTVERRARKELGMVHGTSTMYIVYVPFENKKNLTAEVSHKRRRTGGYFEFLINILGKAKAATFGK